MSNAEAAIKRQLGEQFDHEWQIIEDGIVVALEIFLYYKTQFPRSDVDNFYTTVQECLQDTIISNDNQIECILSWRNKTKSKSGQHAKVYIWKASGNILTDLSEFIKYNKEISQNELGLTEYRTGTPNGVGSSLQKDAVINSF